MEPVRSSLCAEDASIIGVLYASQRVLTVHVVGVHSVPSERIICGSCAYSESVACTGYVHDVHVCMMCAHACA